MLEPFDGFSVKDHYKMDYNDAAEELEKWVTITDKMEMRRVTPKMTLVIDNIDPKTGMNKKVRLGGKDSTGEHIKIQEELNIITMDGKPMK